MQVVNVLNNPVFECSGNRDVVKYREVLNILTQTYASSMRTHWYLELGGQQQYGQNLVDPAESGAVYLAVAHSSSRKILLEHDTVVYVSN